MARFRNSFPAYGDPRRDALARALQYGGMALAQGAGTRGFGALAEAVPAATFGYGEGMEQGYKRQEAERKRQEEEAERARRGEVREREDRRWEHTMKEWERAEDERERKRIEQEAGRAAEKERREGMIAGIREAQGDNAARRAALLSPAKLEAAYLEATGEAEPPKSPTTRNFPDGSLRQWDPGSKSWQVLQHEPAGKKEPRLTPGQLRNEAQEAADREVGTWPDYKRRYLASREMSLPPRDESTTPGQRVGRATVLGTDPKTDEPVFDEQQLRKRWRQEWQSSFETNMGNLSGRGQAPAQGRNPTGMSDLPGAGDGENSTRAPVPGGGGRFEQLAGQVQQQLQERGAPAEAQRKIQEVVRSVENSVPPEVRDSQEFLQLLQQEIASGKDPEQIAREIREAFGGR